MASATIDRFLVEVSRMLREQNGPQLAQYLHIEPPYPDPLYTTMISELRSNFPKGSEDALENKCARAVPEASGNGIVASWTAFLKFLIQYFVFIRDVDVQNLLETYNLLSELVQKCNSALSHGTLGILILPTVITYSRSLARLAIGLDKQPHLIAHLKLSSNNRDKADDEPGARETLPERAANIIRAAFTTCLNDRSGTASGIKNGAPDGKKAGIYRIANLCMKVMFQCRKTRSAAEMFANIDNQSPPLSYYPRAERVTYLYYLGRFLFSTSHFYRAQKVLQAAYDETHIHSLKQRRLILIYLTSSNIILGRFPSTALLSRPEAQGLDKKFHPLCLAIQRGDLTSFRAFCSMENPNADWFLHFRIFLQLRNRCEVLVWRSLFRRTFAIAGSLPADSRMAPTLSLEDVLRVAQCLEGRATSVHASRDADLDGVEEDEEEARGLHVRMLEVESMTASLLVQGLLNGYLSQKTKRFAILGARAKAPLDAGFPNVWGAVKGRVDGEAHVPGWVVRERREGGGGPGSVVNLSGVRPVGVAG